MTNEDLKKEFLRNFIFQLRKYVKYHGGHVSRQAESFITFKLNHQKFHVLKSYNNSIRIYFIKGKFIERVIKFNHKKRNISEMLHFLMNITKRIEKQQILNGEAQF